MFREDIDDSIPGDSGAALGPTAAHLNRGDVGWGALGPAIAFTALATTVVMLRWYARARIVRCIGLDDWVILLSLLCAITMCILIGIAVHSGIGITTPTSPLLFHHTTLIARLIVANNSLWSLTVNITKSSILTQYLRIFSSPRTRTICYILLFLLLPATCWGIFGGIFLCNPTAKLWNPEISGHCRNAQTYWVSVASVDIFLDLAILILPIPAIAALHLPRKQRVATLCVFLLGFVVCAVSVIRLATVLAIAQQGDFVMSGIWAIIWSVVEANVGIVCASLLALKCLIVKLWPGLLEEEEEDEDGNLRVPKRAMEVAMITDDDEKESGRPVGFWRTGDSETATLEQSGSSWSTLKKSEGESSSAGRCRIQPAMGPFVPTRRPELINREEEGLSFEEVLQMAHCGS
ncbi:unnamed protein product [Zymoseptoria tritici ST99CH_3D1]|nr:unnamed protein product [Zymoseptoria tritici ST99CH_3D1]